MDSTDSIIVKIKAILNKYYNTESLDEKIDYYEQIALNSVYLAEELSIQKQDYNATYYDRQISISHSYLNNKAEKITEKTSMEMAKTDTEDKKLEELEREATVLRLDLFLKQINRVLDSIRTKISYLKNEKIDTNN